MLSDGPTPPILLCDATWYGTLAAVWDLGSRGVPVTVACETFTAPARWSRYATQVVSCPPSKDSTRFPQWLLDFGRRHPGYVLYPTSDELAWYVARDREELAKHFRLFTPSLEGLARILDKQTLARDGAEAGVDVPETFCPKDEAAVEEVARKARFPVYLKPRTQVLSIGVTKGRRVDTPAELLGAWRSARASTTYRQDVRDAIPGVDFPILQSSCERAERVYTVDGFVDPTGELYASLACTKLLQRPRSSGPGMIFEHSPLDPAIDEGLRRLCRSTGFCGVFDAEFVEDGDRKRFIDFNPRFYNHMVYEVDRGLPLPWMAYLAAVGNWEAVRSEVAAAKASSHPPKAYVHRLPAYVMLGLQRLSGGMSGRDLLGWRHWLSDHRAGAVDPACRPGDVKPRIAALAMEAGAFLHHPRSYLRHMAHRP